MRNVPCDRGNGTGGAAPMSGLYEDHLMCGCQLRGGCGASCRCRTVDSLFSRAPRTARLLS